MRKDLSGKLQLPWMIILAVLTQGCMVIRSGIIASNFGPGVELDAFNLVNNMTGFFITFISAGVTSIVLPAYVKKTRRESVDCFLSWLWVIVTAILLLLFLLRTPIVSLIKPNNPLVNYTDRIMLFVILMQAFAAVLSVTAAYYQSTDRFTVPKLIQLFSAVGSVLGLVFLKNFTIYQYVTILLIFSVARSLTDILIAVKCGFRFRFRLRSTDGEIRGIVKTFIPVVFSSGVYQVHSLVDSMIASSLRDGTLTLYTYANLIVSSVNSLIIGNMTLYAYPKIVRARQISAEEGQKVLWRYAYRFHAVICLMIVLFCGCGCECISLLFGHGKFDAQSVVITYWCTGIYFFGQQFNVIRDLIYRYFFAEGDTVTTLKNSVVVSVINIILSLVLVRFLGLYGIALGTIAAGAFSLFSIRAKMRRKLIRTGEEYRHSHIAGFVKNSVVTALCIAVLLSTRYFFVLQNPFLSLAVYGLLAAFCFGLGIFLLNRDLFRWAASEVRSILKRG